MSALACDREYLMLLKKNLTGRKNVSKPFYNGTEYRTMWCTMIESEEKCTLASRRVLESQCAHRSQVCIVLVAGLDSSSSPQPPDDDDDDDNTFLRHTSAPVSRANRREREREKELLGNGAMAPERAQFEAGTKMRHSSGKGNSQFAIRIRIHPGG